MNTFAKSHLGIITDILFTIGFYKYIRRTFVPLLFVCLFYSSAFGQSTDNELEKTYNTIQNNKSLLSKIDKKIISLKKTITLTENEKADVYRQISIFVKNEDRLERKIISLEKAYKKTVEDRLKLQKKLTRTVLEIDVKKDELSKLILILLKFAKYEETSILPTNSLKRIPSRESNAFRQYAYNQSLKIGELNRLLKEEQKLESQIISKEAKAKRQKTQTEKALEELKFNKIQYETYLVNLNREHKSSTVKLTALENERRKLDVQLNNLWKKYLATKKESNSALSGFGKKSTPFLLQPLNGKIITFFGSRDKEIKGSNFRGIVVEPFNKNLKVFAAYSGNVSYVTQLRGFGNVVILDHGKSDYTVYGMLGDVFAKTGAFVKKGEPLGIAGQNDAGKLRFYFELRVKKQPKNPAKYIVDYTWK